MLDDIDVVRGKLIVNPAAFAFAEPEAGGPSVFVAPGARGAAMDGDEVLLDVWPGKRGPEGRVRSVVVRSRTRITGVLKRRGKALAVVPDDPRVLGEAEVVGKSVSPPGLVVVGRIVDYPDERGHGLRVQVERALGKPGSLATEEMRILVEHGIDPQLPKPVVRAAELVEDHVTETDKEGRADLTNLDFMTIDPPDARDFDDAVCMELLGDDLHEDVMRIHVAVADVSHYVKFGDVFDGEAIQRCFSTYLPDRVVPMLPMPLSAGICSLVPYEERCAMVVTYDIDREGEVIGEPDVRAAFIRSRARLTYDEVARTLEGDHGLEPVVEERVKRLRMASDRLSKARRRRGAIELDLPEIKVRLDEDDPERVREVVSARATLSMTRAYNLIEELMVAANEMVGQIGVKYRLPIVYRVHDRPDEERIERFCAVADLMGVEVDAYQLQSPMNFRKFLRSLDEHPRKVALHSLLLRALAQAEYSTQNIGHFALASRAYAHFTSPIRRYPDLINHRVMKAWIKRKGGSAGPEPVPKMPAMRDASERAERSSDRERAVTQAERDAKALLCAAFMRDRIGDTFEGTISGMSMSGVFVTLDDPPVDGMIRKQQIEKECRESFEIDVMSARMVGSKSKRAIMVGDRVTVIVADVSLERRQIDFTLRGIEKS